MIVKQEISLVVLRIMLGIVFLFHGISMFQGGIDKTAVWFDSIGLPGILASVIAVLEMAGGIALMIGFGTRLVSALFGFLMLGAIIKVKLSAGFLGNGKIAGYELELACLAMSLCLMINGSKQFSAGQIFIKNFSDKTILQKRK